MRLRLCYATIIIKEMNEITKQLDAKVQGDDGEIYYNIKRLILELVPQIDI